MTSTQWILQQRPSLSRPSPGDTLLGQHDEWEAASSAGQPIRVRTLFLRGSECRFHCTMCDLWQHTHSGNTQPGAIPAQIRQGLHDLATIDPRSTWLKLYNASSFFDTKNVPSDDLPTIAGLVASFQRVIVENHPRLFSSSVIAPFVEQIQPAQLELAMGLETVHDEVLRKLNKQMTVDDFRQAVEQCHQQQIAVRAFVLLQTPWLTSPAAMQWCRATIDAARQMGVQHICVIPVRGGNGALEQLASFGEFTPPTAHMLEQIFIENLVSGGCLVTVDLWDWDKLRGTCPQCSTHRRARLAEMNLHRKALPVIACEVCDVS